MIRPETYAMHLAVLRWAADGLPDDDADRLHQLIERVKTGAPPLANAADRAALARAVPHYEARFGPDEVRTKAVRWLAAKCGV